MRKAKDALENVNGLELDGRDVRLDYAKGARGGGAGGGDDRRGGGARGGGGGGRGELSISVWPACEYYNYADNRYHVSLLLIFEYTNFGVLQIECVL